MVRSVVSQIFDPSYGRMDMSPAFGVFDPEGSEYDYRSALIAGLAPDNTGHWPSRVPNGPLEGLLLKGRGHETWYKTVAAEDREGYEIYKKNGRYWSKKKEK